MSAADRLAVLHATGFDGAARWSAAAFARALTDPSFFFAYSGPGRAPDGFAMGRAAAGEAELLTLVVSPALRRRGLGGGLLDGFEAKARARGAEAAFLEAATDNAAALRLYASRGWARAGRRRGYYGGIDALVLRKVLADGG